MSETDTPATASPVCPGSRTLLKGNEKVYLRLVFTVYWMGAPPSSEVFYFTDHPIRLNPRGIAALEHLVLDLLTKHVSNPPLSAIYVGYSGIELNAAYVAEADWRVIVGE